jgi:hypothetical protein
MKGKESLTSFFIDKGLICDHQFQFSVDKDFKIQRYQIIDQDEID